MRLSRRNGIFVLAFFLGKDTKEGKKEIAKYAQKNTVFGCGEKVPLFFVFFFQKWLFWKIATHDLCLEGAKQGIFVNDMLLHKKPENTTKVLKTGGASAATGENPKITFFGEKGISGRGL